MIKYILFDLDGTILNFKEGEKDAFIKTINEYSNYLPTNDDIKKFSEINEYYFNEYSKGHMDRPTFHYNRFNEISKFLNIDIDPIIANKFYVETLKYEAQLYADFKNIINYLYDKYELYVASNGMNDVQIKRLEIAKINNYFKDYYISEKIGFNKPSVDFFNYIFKSINDYDKDKYVIIGDRLDSDILGGINAGIHTIYINRDNILNEIKAEYTITKLEEILNIL